MKKRQPIVRRLVLAVALSGTVAAVALAFVPTARESQFNNGLFAYVVASNRGPLPGCLPDGSNCTAANWVWWYIHVLNVNPLKNFVFGNPPGPTRPTVPNAFVVSSVDEATFVNGLQIGQSTLVPPPNLTGRFFSAGRFISTVTCGLPITVPCNKVTSPAVLPGENVAVFFDGWMHSTEGPPADPNGILVEKFTVHGTLNGAPINLTANSQSILETP
jgi:hypothetical protein